jgi:lipopolysaccharide biosynthesis glycosyltransferase
VEKIHLVTATNNDYSKYLVVMLFSLIKNKKSDHPLVIYVLERELSLENKELIRRIILQNNIEIKFVNMNESQFKDVRISGHISMETYFRIRIPELLSRDIKKVLYLDCDMIIHDDITRLWETNIDDYFLAAVEDPLGYYRFEDLSITNNRYFNAGVLLINLKKWRENSISQRVSDYIHDNLSKIYWWDQDALNAILFDKWLMLEMKWNYQPFSRIQLDNPSIIHFTSPIKPWNGDPPLKEYYFFYANQIKW